MNLLPLLAFSIRTSLNCSIGYILRACIESVKTVYFTIFCTTIVHLDQIPEAYREQFIGYLRTNQSEPAA